MEKFLLYHRRMFFISGAACALLAVGLAMVLPGDHLRLWGFVVGAAAQMVKFGFLDVRTIKRMAAAPDGAARIQLRASGLSLLIFLAAIAFVFLFGLDVWTMAAGIFLPRIILLADAFIRPDPFGGSAENEERHEGR